jgi:hypothetical protein
MINLGMGMINIVNRNYQCAAGDTALSGRATEAESRLGSSNMKICDPTP